MNDKQNWPSWRCPAGPVNVWKIVEGHRKLEDGSTQPVKISIQQVPQERREETIDFMIKYFLVDEPLCKSINALNDPEQLEGMRIMWNYCLDQGIVEAAYIIDSNGDISELVSVNMLFVESKETEEDLDFLIEKKLPEKSKKTFTAVIEFSKKADACQILGVDKYISAFGLVVARHMRGQKLGLRMLEARVDIGKKYNIPASSTVFTAPASQILAKRAGFEEKLSQDYVDFVDENNQQIFPNVDSKCMKMMMRMLY